MILQHAPPIARQPAIVPAPAADTDAFGIYIHIPFCRHICPYCDFNTYSGQEGRIPRYVNAVVRETAQWSSPFSGRLAGSIFFGGGTPSLLTPDQIASILAACRDAFDVSKDAEITLEANPNDLEESFCADLRAAGINRLSIGAQTLDRRGLRVLGRLHDASHVSSAVAAARTAGFDNLSLDFIYGWPGQSLESWADDLERTLSGEVGSSRPDHLSLYSLIVEPGTPMADAASRGILVPVDEDDVADFYELAISKLAAAGWQHYEISNWCASPDRASRHNAVYWRNGDYPGLGAGAHGHVDNRRTMNQPSPRRYIEALEGGHLPISNTELIDERTAMAETMMLGLRLLDVGVSGDAFQRRHGVSLAEQFGPQLTRLTGLGMLDISDRSVCLTERGVLLANSICAEFL
jgi:oxygen-independent coproporphyrinogen-3 oxidase